ncbi:phosphoribosylformylglycinamidine cyclo-ligase [Candidatus Parcubacteria bacterium]|nr:phosphoribosylformylglycinamidine cyclo-ligase [Candidatus Parcubacteria bacterium]
MTERMTYKGTGVDYQALDPFKRMCQERAALTADNARRYDVSSFESSRGESAFLFGWRDGPIYGLVEEGLGTKSLVADAMYKLTGKSYYDQIAQDSVAMIVNDMATLGIAPLVIAMHLAVGSSDWFKDEPRVRDLIEGWGRACDIARAIWGPGETPTLKGIIMPEASLISGSAVGMPMSTDPLYALDISEGDRIIIFESSGIHANALTLARQIAEKLPEGYLTKLSDGTMYGEALLTPTHIYSAAVEDCLDEFRIKYAVNITGHGWRKLMRAQTPFTYVIERLPSQQLIFDFIQEHGPVSDEEAFGNLNMGGGFALFVSPDVSVEQVSEVLAKKGHPFKAVDAGHIEVSDQKRVVIGPKNLVFEAESLQVR